ncbi:hypothetical protein D3C72_934210 [compost metagenome]
MQVNRHHQLIAQLFVELIEQLTAHIHHLEQRIVNFVIHFAGMTVFDFGDKHIALEKRIALLVDFKLFQTQIRNAVGHVFQFIGGRQRLLLLIKNARKQQTALQHRNLFFNITFRLQRAIQPIFDFDILLNQRVTAFSGLNEPLAELVVNIQFLLHQRIALDTGSFVRRDRFLRCFFRQRQALTVDRFLQ